MSKITYPNQNEKILATPYIDIFFIRLVISLMYNIDVIDKFEAFFFKKKMHCLYLYIGNQTDPTTTEHLSHLN